MKKVLNGNWRAKPDPRDAGVADRWFLPGNSGKGNTGWEETPVPSCWNCDPRYERYEGVFWYSTDFQAPEAGAPHLNDTALLFLGVNYRCRVWINGNEAGAHEGGFLPFEINFPAGALRESNRLVLRVDNIRSAEQIPGENFDWMNYGGITRDVILEARNARRFRHARVSPALLPGGGASLSVSFSQTESFPFKWTVSRNGTVVCEGAVEPRDTAGVFVIDMDTADYWSPESPALYDLRLAPLADGYADPFATRFGVREIRVEGRKILLNGAPVILKGVNLHEELVPFGRCVPAVERWNDARRIKTAGFNALRTAHYTHDEELLRATDEIGLLVLEEIPVYWDLNYKSDKLRSLAASMVGDMIHRDFNHPSVIMWSVGNEIPVENPDCDRLIAELMDLARTLDPSRPATYVSCRFLIDKTRRAADVCCVNCYIGWYWGNEKDLAGLLELTRTTAPDKPWIITEFGACAEKGFRSDKCQKFSEDRQAQFLSHYIKTLNSADWVSGWFIWVWRDFRSPIRNNPHQKGFNRKGLVNEKNEPKLIMDKLPCLIDAKTNPPGLNNARFLAGFFSAIERAAYAIAMPILVRTQKNQYDKFFRK